jgi:diketogulonate reductase-like aldo/keto reductase
VDLFLLHYPDCWADLCGKVRPEGTWQDSWRALEVKVQEGKIRALGVSNFDVNQVRELVGMAKVKPAVVQAHADPLNQNSALVTFCLEHGIVFTAYSTLGTQAGHGYDGANPVMTNPAITAIARQVDRTVVQVVLRWAMQQGMVVLPRSTNPEHIASNLRVYEFELPETAMQKMLALDGVRLGE